MFSLFQAVPSELVRETSQKKVLETVGKIIHVIEKETDSAVLSAADTGRNILNVIGDGQPPSPA